MKRKQQMNKLVRIASGVLLCAYLMFISWRMFFYAFGSYYRSYSVLPEYNLIPFKTIASLIINYRYYEFEVWVYNLFGNLVAFIPLGILLPVVLNIKRKLAATLVFSLVFLIAAETAQLVFSVGVFDVDDIILNMTGVLSGFMVYMFISKLNNKAE